MLVSKIPRIFRCFVSSGILLFFFFLPRLFHSLTAMFQITKKFSCLHGIRTQASLPLVSAGWTPVLTAEPVTSEAFDCFSYVQFQSHGIRAPPLTPSL